VSPFQKYSIYHQRNDFQQILLALGIGIETETEIEIEIEGREIGR